MLKLVQGLNEFIIQSMQGNYKQALNKIKQDIISYYTSPLKNQPPPKPDILPYVKFLSPSVSITNQLLSKILSKPGAEKTHPYLSKLYKYLNSGQETILSSKSIHPLSTLSAIANKKLSAQQLSDLALLTPEEQVVYLREAGAEGFGTVAKDTGGFYSLGGFQFAKQSGKNAYSGARYELIQGLKERQKAINVSGYNKEDIDRVIDLLSSDPLNLDYNISNNKKILSEILKTKEGIALQREIHDKDYTNVILESIKKITVGTQNLFELVKNNAIVQGTLLSIGNQQSADIFNQLGT